MIWNECSSHLFWPLQQLKLGLLIFVSATSKRGDKWRLWIHPLRPEVPCPALGSESQIHAADDSGESHKTCEMPLDAGVVMFSFFFAWFQIVCIIRLWLLLDHVGWFGGFKEKTTHVLMDIQLALWFFAGLYSTLVYGGRHIYLFSPLSLSLNSCLLLLIWSFLIIGGLPPGRMAMFDPILLMFLRWRIVAVKRKPWKPCAKCESS